MISGYAAANKDLSVVANLVFMEWWGGQKNLRNSLVILVMPGFTGLAKNEKYSSL
jgi:hypothetical protein